MYIQRFILQDDKERAEITHSFIRNRATAFFRHGTFIEEAVNEVA